MPIYTNWNAEGPLPTYLEELPVDPSRGRRAAVAEGFADTVGALSFEAGKRRGAAGANLTDEEREAQGGDAVFGTHISRDSAMEQLTGLGFPNIDVPEEGINTRALDVIVDRQNQRRLRQSIIERSSIGGVQRFVAGMVGSIPDPVNLLMLPFAPEATAIRGLSLSARVGTRALAGAKQGVAGAALFEVPHWNLAHAAGDDYTLMDTFINVTVGAVLGSAFHVGGGALRDLGNRKPHPGMTNHDPEAIQTAVTQIYDDQIVDIDAVLNAKATQRLDDFDAQINRAVNEGDFVEARLVREAKEAFLEAGTPNRPPTRKAVADDIADASNDTNVKRQAASRNAEANQTQAGLNALARRQPGNKFIDPEKEAQMDLFLAQEEVPVIRDRPTPDAEGPLTTAEKSKADEEIAQLQREVDESTDDALKQEFETLLAEADEAIAEVESTGAAIRAAALCAVTKGKP